MEMRIVSNWHENSTLKADEHHIMADSLKSASTAVSQIEEEKIWSIDVPKYFNNTVIVGTVLYIRAWYCCVLYVE